MDKIFKKSFQIVIKNSAVMQPLILFILFTLIFQLFMGTSIMTNYISALIYMVMSVLIFSAFLSGWLFTAKYAVDNYIEFDKNDENYPLKIGIYNVETIKKFFVGVGEYFFPVLLTIIFVIFAINIVHYGGMKLLHLKDLNFLMNFVNANPQTVGELPKISFNQILFIFYLLGIIFVLRFFTLFWMPALFYKSKNPIFSLLLSIKFLFKNFLVSVGLYVFLFIIYFVFFFFAGLSTLVPILPLVFFIIFLYLITFSVVLIFEVYRKYSLKEETEEINKKDVFIKSSESGEPDEK